MMLIAFAFIGLAAIGRSSAPVNAVENKNAVTNASSEIIANYMKGGFAVSNLRVEDGLADDIEVSGSLIPMKIVKGTLKNVWAKTATGLGVTVYFLDRNGKKVYQYPIFLNNDFLRPNYSVDFAQPIKKSFISSEWAGRVEVEVTTLNLLTD